MSELAPDLDLRLVRYFTVVAEHRHFGRAAEALHITQPFLSRQIRGLERQLGARLLDRTPHGTRLTEAGEVFLPRAKALLRSSAQAAAATRAAAHPSKIMIGHTLNVPVVPAVRELRHQHPDADVRVVQLAWNEPRAALLERRVDAAVCRLPLRDDGLHVTVLYDEPRVLLVARDHRLAGKEHVTLDDIGDEALPRLPDAAWNAYWRIDPRPDGSRAPDGPLVEAPEEKFELIAARQAVAIVSAGLRAETLHPDVTSIPLEGAEPSQVVLATRAGDNNGLLAPFLKAARIHLTGSGSADFGAGPGVARTPPTGRL
ncbi:LysR family transcriptional regulator [Nonomuraea diastatica]|uniref:LysR family transcriptional regulator n=1 Tax=Nonomuraea diastatica TaxID=1848329 RepID=A0A4R4X1S1_9ACTN|nr:LysR family transcriptional regulator [Nonomuraea diastatica]TDD24140.1 LysR family transcriptional regulator [Nonomuraea diastatica]